MVGYGHVVFVAQNERESLQRRAVHQVAFAVVFTVDSAEELVKKLAARNSQRCKWARLRVNQGHQEPK